MPQSLVRIIGHIVFSTKNRQTFLSSDVRPPLYAYMAGILKEASCTPILIGGTEDHVHALTSLSKNLAPCQIVQQLKESSSKWVKRQRDDLHAFQWQSGYAIFSIGESGIPSAKRYVANQEAHHRRVSFEDELRLLLTRYKVAFDERYVWD